MENNNITMKEIERDFIVTAKMKFSGMLPNMVIKDHIESKIRNKIENTCNDIVLDGEYYGNYNMEWQIFLEGDVDINTMEYNITFREEPFCEHCGERYTDFGIEIEDQGTTWCLDCFYSNGHLSDKQYNELSIKERIFIF